MRYGNITAYLSKTFACTLACACCVISVACGKGSEGGTSKDTPENNTPRTAAVSFVTALENGDLEVVHRTAFGPVRQFAMASRFSQHVQAAKRFQDATRLKFGEAAKVPIVEPRAPLIQAGEEKVDGDVATIKSKSGQLYALKKDSGGWKVNLTAFFSDDSVRRRAEIEMLKAEMFEAAAKEVASGNFKDVKQASDEVWKRETEIILGRSYPNLHSVAKEPTSNTLVGAWLHETPGQYVGLELDADGDGEIRTFDQGREIIRYTVTEGNSVELVNVSNGRTYRFKTSFVDGKLNITYKKPEGRTLETQRLRRLRSGATVVGTVEAEQREEAHRKFEEGRGVSK